MGEELISIEPVALTEPVENAHDIDVSLAAIRFVVALQLGASSIEVWDDGHGVSPEDLDLAGDRPQSEERGRPPLGAKGNGAYLDRVPVD
ncbi:hypothetical protein [Streptomyces sp. cmx-18-6]|uniref:hypothetical protein n=1 Tax=Streptomyces sp. cmx-18-6 TaxID=2790930 RepID=UPI00397FEC18